jgi:beta-mannanase
VAQVLVDRADITALKALADKLNAFPDYTAPAPPQPTGSVYHGVTAPQSPWNMADLDAFEALAGKKTVICSYFIGWNANIYSLEQDRLDAIKARGAVPMITWQWAQIANLTEVINGTYDQSAIEWAQKLKAFGWPVLLRWGHEMNVPNYAWSVGKNGNTSAQFIAAWKRLRGIFVAQGATNVLWVWSPGVRGGNVKDFVPMFPGATQVDWLGLDGYNWNAPWLTFTQVMQDSYNAITALTTTKPLMIAEWGCSDQGGDKGAWLKSALQSEIPAMPRIKAVVYFNTPYDNQNWRIDSSPAASAGYAAGVAGYRSVWP